MSAFRVRFLASGLALSLFVIGCGRDVSKKQKDPGPTSNNSSCGDGLLAPSEKCDPAIGAGDVGACPTSCAGPTGGCATSTLVGDAESCTAQCVTVDAACAGGDGCCAPQCDATSDSDCTNTCGDGVVEGSEACDGNCPRGCDDGDACTVDGSTGSAATCSLVCTHAPVTACSGGDGCCPAGCSFDTDTDCSDSGACGNGVLDPGELCDGDCPASCDDGVACTTDSLVGAAATCNAQCVFETISQCVDGDGCCAAGCSSVTDNDCPCSPRTCADVGATCGTIDDLCGATLGCGTCGADESCQGGSCIVDTPTGALGDSCVANGDCVSDDCLSEADFAMPGGYCTDACQTSADCGANGYCSASVCYERCVSASDCRPGYACTEQLGSTMACFPEGSGTGPVGAPCASVNDCTGGSLGYCIARGDGWKDGYCSQLCDGTASCPVGTHCAFDDDGTGLCVVNCSSSSTCRGGGFDGYQCYDRDGDSVRECAAAGTGTADVGEPCEGTWECSGGDAAACGTERDGFPDGYCVELCGPNSSCPAGSTCALTLASQYCLDSCAVDAECRSGYLCQSDLFQKVCWPQ